MKKAVFSITNVRSKSDKKLSGFGYLAEGNLLCPCISKNSKPYIRIFEDVEKRCHPVNGRQDEFQGYVTMYFTEVPVYREKDGSYDMINLLVKNIVLYKDKIEITLNYTDSKRPNGDNSRKVFSFYTYNSEIHVNTSKKQNYEIEFLI